MKLMTIILALAITTSCYADGTSKGKHLFILSGQSNMQGMNPKTSFIPVVVKEFGKENVTVVKSSKNGQPIRRWYKDYKYPEGVQVKSKGEIGLLYDKLIAAVKKATAGKTYDTVTFVWMQGESDAGHRLYGVYADSFKGILAQLENDLKLDSINFVIGRLSDHALHHQKGARKESYIKMREIQVKLAEDDPKGEWVNTDDLNDKIREGGVVFHDGHFTKDGYISLGQRFAEKSIGLIKGQQKK